MNGPPFQPPYDVWVNPHDPGDPGGQSLFALAPDDELAPVVERTAQAAAENRGKWPGLLEEPPAVPDPCTLQLVQKFIRHAAECGLELPIILLRFVHATSHDRNDGEVSNVFRPAREHEVVRITLRNDLAVHRLARVTWHECAHAADLRSGVVFDMAPEEQERRAVAFSIVAADRYSEVLG